MKSLIFCISFLAANLVFGQDLIRWYTWEEGMVKAEEESKKLFVDLYTDWCKWCKEMDKATFQNKVIADYINENYIAIKFNAEQRGEIVFKGETFKFVKGGRKGYHTLATSLTKGRLSYPTVVFMDEDMEVIQAIPGYLDVPTFDPIMRYFAENFHKSTPWATYLRRYKSDQDEKKSSHSRLVNQKGN